MTAKRGKPAKSAEQEEWDAKVQYEVGVLILRQLATFPSPGKSDLEPRLRQCGLDLRDMGRAQLDRLGKTWLYSVRERSENDDQGGA